MQRIHHRGTEEDEGAQREEKSLLPLCSLVPLCASVVNPSLYLLRLV
jgi:hypothetical protein